MALAAGTRLGPYEILSSLGAGGMGEVYRARDTRLSRDVAVKVLPSERTPSPEARERFEREARTISRLSHPHVCVLHDVGREGETEYLVMELLEGESLADRLGRGALPLSQALRYGAEIASALDAAHRRGIVHRDLKPGNVMLTKEGVKLLDFGLARGFAGADAPGGLTEAPTIAPLTAEGVIVGTVAYMAPEQLEGREADARTDIFALGAVLYEMLTGRKAFTGASNATLISAILTSDPPSISSLQPVTPPELDRLVRTCLSKDPAERWQSAHDVELQLKAVGGSGATAMPAAVTARTPRRVVVPWAIAAIAAALATVAFLRGSRPSPAPPATIRFSIPPPENGAFGYTAEGDFLAISPDGSQLAYVAAGAEDRESRVWVRPISALEARPLSGTEGANSLMWSPDGRSIAFFTRDKLKRLDLAGGAPVPICDIPTGGGGKAGSWGRSDILFTSIQGAAIYRVPASGGQPAAAVRIDPSGGELRVAWPWFLPDGERFLYVVRERENWGNLMLVEPGKAPRPVTRMASFFQYVEPGYLLFAREGTLLAQRFDAASGHVSGEPVSVADRVRYFFSTASAGFAARGRTVAYQSQEDVRRLAWFDRSGKEIEKVGAPGGYLNVFLAADGKRLLFERTRPGIQTYHIWSFDLERGVETPITDGLDTEAFPRLLADGKTLIFSAVRGTPPRLTRRDLATGQERPLTGESDAFQVAEDVSPDGRLLIYKQRTESGNFDIWSVPVDGSGKPEPVLQSPFVKSDPRFSPDGRYLAFIGTESGRPEAYVMPFPGPGERVRLSNEGARSLRWGRDGEIFYISGDGRLVAVRVQTTPSLQIGAPVTLFQLTGRPWAAFDVSADCRRFVAVVPEIVGSEKPLYVIVNWAPGAR